MQLSDLPITFTPPRPSLTGALEPLHATLRGWVAQVFASTESFGIDYEQPAGDPGLFGPDSVTWKIHSDFPGMMAGGVAALMLQTLHPRAMAGMWDHSVFREDPLGRLRRTSVFVAATGYAPTADAERLIALVRGIHDHVHGTTLDGQPYCANDPDLLTWVHCTEMVSFLKGYMRFCRPDLSLAVQDQYFNETRRIAEKLGARDVPASKAEMDAYFAAIQPELCCDSRVRESLAVMDSMALPIPFAGLSRRLYIGAGASLLPDWAQTRMARGRRQRAVDQAAAIALKLNAPLIRGAMTQGVGTIAARRCGVSRACLSFD